MTKKSLIRLIISILICQLAGFLGSLFTTPSIPTWYASLEKPSFNPPNWLFSPVWITLFVLMGISLYLLLEKSFREQKVKKALIFFAIQLVLNVFWSILFFGLKSPLFAFFEIIILWVAISLTIIQSFKISKIASFLLLPYILWVSFAAILNYFLWNLN